MVKEPKGVVPPDPIAQALAYHRRTKHHLHQYALGPGYLDWATQPDPFRTFAGAPRTNLPILADRLTASYADLYQPGTVTAQPLSMEDIAVLFELALGLSAWKEFQGVRWALRCNPSSGNLHPTEGYVVVPEMSGLAMGIYHYVSRNHCLERRCTNPTVILAPGTFLIGLSSIHWREAWKYGERAFRYCQHDVGHALASVRYAAAALGWSAALLDHLADDAVAALLGLDHAASFADVKPADREHPDAILLILTSPTEGAVPGDLPLPARDDAPWAGRANPLSPSHVAWPEIDKVAAATWKPATSSQPTEEVTLPPLCPTSLAPAAELIRQRRSCLGLDGATSIAAGTFYAMLDHLLPRPAVPPWDMLPWAPLIHAGVFVHRVRGLAPGLYAFERSPAVHDRLRAATHGEFAWQRVAGCPDHLRLFLLAEGDCRAAAGMMSCHQEIAADGAFSLGMIADFGCLKQGAWWYRRLFWEAGVLGQVLYLEAEAAGVRGTGIGCYFDDVFHQRLGLHSEEFQDLYHFTLGGPVVDSRLTTLPPYTRS